MNPNELLYQHQVLVKSLAEETGAKRLLTEEIKSIKQAYGELSTECADLRFRLAKYEKVEIKFKPVNVGDFITVPQGHRLQGKQGKVLNVLKDDEALLVEVGEEQSILKWDFNAVQSR